MSIEKPSYRYRVDGNDMLIAVDSLWLAFARENGAANLTEASVVGRSLWDFVGGKTVRAIYSEIHARVRSSGKPAVFPFRCDSPTLRRYMRMSITLGESGQLNYDCLIQRTVPQRRLVVLDAEQKRTNDFLTICSGCKRALLESVGWLDVEDVAFRMGLLEADTVPQLRHTFCPVCTDAMRNNVLNSDVA